MTHILLILWVIGALFIVASRKMLVVMIFFGVFSLITSLCFLLLGAPDVAMAEAAMSAFQAIFLVVCLEKYYRLGIHASDISESVVMPVKKYIIPVCFSIFLFGAFVYFIPDISGTNYLKDMYIASFMLDLGGNNAVTAIYLGYRVYDTLFEALMLVVSVVAVTHMSYYTETEIKHGATNEMRKNGIAVLTIRIICPLILMYGVYLVINGHITPGGGFQGGLAIASFFICRYFIYNIYDIPVKELMRIEEIIFALTILLAVLFIFFGAISYLPIFQDVYPVMMNAMIGIKVACAFVILFYRYIVFERK